MTQDWPDQGSPPLRRCMSCGAENPAHHNFCSDCGAPLAAPMPYRPARPVTIRDIGRLVGIYSTLPLLMIITANVVIALWAIGLVYPQMDMYSWPLFLVTPWLVTFLEITGWSFLIYYVLLALAITISFIWMLKVSRATLTGELRGTASGGHSPLFTIGTLFMAVLAFNLIFYALASSSGGSPSSPDFGSSSLMSLIYSLASASVWEEVVTRILLLGMPLLLIDMVRRKSVPRLRERKLRQYVLGGGLEIGRSEAILLLFSSIMFGLAHIWSWDPWKIIPSVVAGLAFGYLFLKLGIYASILLHFAFDFLSMPLMLWPDSLVLGVLLSLTTLLWVTVGLGFILYYGAKGLGWLTGRRIWPDTPLRPVPTAHTAPPSMYRHFCRAPAYPPEHQPWTADQYQLPPSPMPQRPARPANPTVFGYQCLHCGNMEARYEEGRLICTRCGRD